MIAADRKISLVHPQPHTVVVDCGAASATAGIKRVPNFMITGFRYGGFGPLQFASPDL